MSAQDKDAAKSDAEESDAQIGMSGAAEQAWAALNIFLVT